ncbi:MAG TPA: outer envelope protein [Burkholderiaceae bacterium]|nr:outer envelope protein [Burkholderiaceae bacterium]
MTKTMKGAAAIAAGLLSLGVQSACAADWSDTYIGWRYGTKFREPYNDQDITKNILNLNHVSGYAYGTNFFNVDLLLSDDKDPSAPGASSGAQEVYIVYRNALDFAKISGSSMNYGLMRSWGLTFGGDANAKTDAGYNSKKRMLVLGPTLMVNVPGFLNISVLAFWESNAPHNDYTGQSVSRYQYKTHPALDLNWGIPLGAGFSFEGYGDFIASKGKNEFGGDTAPETHFDMQVMYNITSLYDAKKNTFKVGLEYEYWKNKFGNDHNGPAGSGAFAKTPMIRAEYHF